MPTPQPTCNFKLLILIAIFLFFSNNVFAETPFQENFDAYSPGDLVPQGDWATTTNATDTVQVSSTTSYSAPNSIFWTSGDYNAIKEGEHATTGYWGFWAKVNSATGTNAELVAITLTETTYADVASAMYFSCVDNDCETSELVKIEACLASIPDNMVEIDQIPIDTWTFFEVEWDANTNKTRWKSDFGSWSNWGQCASNTFDYVQGFYIQGASQTGKLEINLDEILATCDVGACDLCETYSTCSDAGCYWYYSIYLHEYYCVEPFVPDADECGSFFKCQFCLTQTPCEAELNCEWVDKGLGVQCYMTEPTIPPTQADWEVPDLDDCGELSGVELWLCEIRNDITGLYMPSQAKLETLYQTIGAFKQKFPFNYVSALNYFFTGVSEGLATTTTIPIEILGSTSTISFTFWDSTTTIGGDEETFKNILYDFTTFAILMGWFVWLISLIKRFF